ncbi:MAG: PRC-barrel domain-containing protein [Solirubrobacteraceae bacterium]
MTETMDPQDLGDLVAYTAIADGTPVYDHQGRRIGVAEHVMEVGGIFEGVIVHTHPLPGRHLYADADQIAEIHERGVVLSVTQRELHAPEQESRRGRAGVGESSLEARLRRAWDWLTGRRVPR